MAKNTVLDYEFEVKGLDEEFEDLVVDGTIKGGKLQAKGKKSTIMAIAKIFGEAIVKAGKMKDEVVEEVTEEIVEEIQE